MNTYKTNLVKVLSDILGKFSKIVADIALFICNLFVSAILKPYTSGNKCRMFRVKQIVVHKAGLDHFFTLYHHPDTCKMRKGMRNKKGGYSRKGGQKDFW